MTAASARRAEGAVTTAAEQVFAVVDRIRARSEEVYRQVIASGRQPCGDDISSLRTFIQQQLAAESALVVGLGLIVAPGLLADQPLRLEWWQAEPGHVAPVGLAVDLKRSSPGFYDYATTEWFAVPHTSGRRHIMGPYVDVHGTGRYVLTFTIPVTAGDVFVGVAGADVSAPALERRLIAEFGSEREVLVVNPEGRVVLSNSPRWVQGDRIAGSGPAGPGTVTELTGLPWQVWRDVGIPLTSEV